METITLGIILAVLGLSVVSIISLLVSVHFEIRKLQIFRPTSLEPKPQYLASKSGKVYVATLKRKVIYNDDEKLWLKEQEKRSNEDGSGRD